MEFHEKNHSGDYIPLDISSWCDIGIKWLRQVPSFPSFPWIPDAGNPPDGSQVFRGPPILVARSKESPIFIGFGVGASLIPIEILVQKNVHWIIIAHRLLDSYIQSGETLGTNIASYYFCYEDGSTSESQIRERFEISVVRPQWEQLPILTGPDEMGHLLPKGAGPWEQIKLQQVEI